MVLSFLSRNTATDILFSIPSVFMFLLIEWIIYISDNIYRQKKRLPYESLYQNIYIKKEPGLTLVQIRLNACL